MAGVTEFNNSKTNLIMQIRKRDGRIVSFVRSKISDAIYKALVATGKPDYPLAERLANKVVQKMVQQGYDSVEKELQKISEIVRLNYTTGNYSMFAEVVCKDINQLRFVLHDQLQKIKGIERTETFISLEESFSCNAKVLN